MTRRRLKDFDYARAGVCFHVTMRARRGSQPFRNATISLMVIDALHWLRANRDTHIYAYCLMPDHLHMLFDSDSGLPLATLMQIFKRHRR